MSQATARRRRIARLRSAAVAFCCRSRSSSCATQAGVWGSPFGTSQRWLPAFASRASHEDRRRSRREVLPGVGLVRSTGLGYRNPHLT